MSTPNGPSWRPPCPVCGRPAPAPGPASCATCGLPAAGQAALVVARIGATIDELARDRDQLLATLRAAAGGPAASPAASHVPPYPDVAPAVAGPPPIPGATLGSTPELPVPRPARRRVSPQQVLLGLGALLVVAAAVAFVAVAWTRLGVAFQAAVMLTVTATACGVSAWTARQRLRATEEALAAAGAALLAVDLGAAHALGLAGVDAVPIRLWTAVSCAVVAAVALTLGRLTTSTATWPLVALLAAQPVPLLLLPAGAVAGSAGVAVALAVALLDVLVCLVLRPPLHPVPLVLAGCWAVGGAAGGVATAWGRGPVDSWTAGALLLASGALALASLREPRLAERLPTARLVAAVGAGAAALALAGSLRTLGGPGPVAAAVLGVGLLTAAVLAVELRTAFPALLTAGTTFTAVGALLLLAEGRDGVLGLVVLGATVPAALGAVRLPELRPVLAGATVLGPVAAVLLVHDEGWLSTPVTGLLLALVAAAAFGAATLRTPVAEEPALVATGTLAGLTASASTAAVGAWGQVALALAVTGAVAGCYALVAQRREVAVAAIADLVVASWVAVGGAGVQTPEAYTLPAAVALALVALPRLRAGVRSWAAEGPALTVALLPSALVVVAEPSALRLVLVVAGAAALAVAGTLAHRQAPFVLGAAALGFVVLGRLTPYAPLLPRWLSLAMVGLLLLVLGATYERRRQQAREAVAWVVQMH